MASDAKLSFRGIEAWLQDSDGKPFAHGPPVVDENCVTIAVGEVSRKSYSVEWRKCPNAPPINALCEIFRHDGRVANHYMVENDSETQSRSTKGRLEHPLPRDGLLWTPRSGIGFVTLEIQQLRKPPKEIETPNTTNPGSSLYEIQTDPDEDQEKIIFRFEFTGKPKAGQPKRPTPLPSDKTINSPASLRRSGPQTLKQSSNIPELSSSDSPDPEEPSSVAGPSKSTGTPNFTSPSVFSFIALLIVPQKRKQPRSDETSSPIDPPQNAGKDTPRPHYWSSEQLRKRGRPPRATGINIFHTFNASSCPAFQNAAREEEEKLDDELQAKLRHTKERIAKKKMILGK
ncbi:hypothetical protein B0H14DRAFT_3126364 [Mycena olivaceomarginata]|nr:hypothetical protein B0H14DRAFT_3126364 [Mycena olivaceomarginata]